MDMLHEIAQSSLPQLVDRPTTQQWLHTLG